MSMNYDMQEIDEAINAANDALYHLSAALEYLNKSRNWGIFDIIGGGIIVSLIKNSKIRDAQRELSIAKESLDRLSYELQDVDMYLDDDLDITGFLGIADTIFDNFGLDLLTQTKVKKTINDVEQMISHIEGVLDALSDIKAGSM